MLYARDGVEAAVDDERSRIFVTLRGADAPRANASTAAVDPRVLSYVRVSPRDAFVSAWPALRAQSAALGHPGIVMAAVDVKGVAAVGAVAARGPLTTAVIGRHSKADLHLPGDSTLSLRHLAVLIEPVGARDVRYRVLDLVSGAAFCDEEGVSLDAIETDGPAFLTSATYRLLLIPTRGDGFADLPADGAAWEAMPPRRYTTLARPEAEAAAPRVIREGSRVLRLAGPVRDGHVVAREELAGTLVGDTLFLPLDIPSVRRGVVLGRYPRCAGARIWGADATVSRVHALLIAFRGASWVVDLASTNGVLVDGASVRQAPLAGDERLLIGQTRCAWVPAERARASGDMPE